MNHPNTNQCTSHLESRLSSAPIRLGERYVYLHAGGCAHFMIFGTIRLLHTAQATSPKPRKWNDWSEFIQKKYHPNPTQPKKRWPFFPKISQFLLPTRLDFQAVFLIHFHILVSWHIVLGWGLYLLYPPLFILTNSFVFWVLDPTGLLWTRKNRITDFVFQRQTPTAAYIMLLRRLGLIVEPRKGWTNMKFIPPFSQVQFLDIFTLYHFVTLFLHSPNLSIRFRSRFQTRTCTLPARPSDSLSASSYPGKGIF